MSAEDHFERGNTYFNQSQYQRTIDEYEKALQLDPACYKAWDLHGLTPSQFRIITSPFMDCEAMNFF